MDVVLDLIARDLAEGPWLLAVVVVPLVLGGLAVRAGSRLGWVAHGLTAALVLTYLAYYALSLPNVGAAQGLLLALCVALVASVTAAVGYGRKVRSPRPSPTPPPA